jgi:hypothetical protein
VGLWRGFRSGESCETVSCVTREGPRVVTRLGVGTLVDVGSGGGPGGALGLLGLSFRVFSF